MKNQDLDMFHRGDFQSVNELPFDKIGEAIRLLASVQEEYNLKDMDTLLNLYQDGKTGATLGFEMVNTEKHGMDCKYKGIPLFLEAKSVHWRDDMNNENRGMRGQINFNDTSVEKAQVFKDKKTFLAASVFGNVDDMMFIVFGQNRAIGEKLEDMIKSGDHCRTQKIRLSMLVKQYGFKIIAVSKTKDEVIEMITKINPNTFEPDELRQAVIELKDFRLENRYPYVRRLLLEKQQNKECA